MLSTITIREPSEVCGDDILAEVSVYQQVGEEKWGRATKQGTKAEKSERKASGGDKEVVRVYFFTTALKIPQRA